MQMQLYQPITLMLTWDSYLADWHIIIIWVVDASLQALTIGFCYIAFHNPFLDTIHSTVNYFWNLAFACFPFICVLSPLAFSPIYKGHSNNVFPSNFRIHFVDLIHRLNK